MFGKQLNPGLKKTAVRRVLTFSLMIALAGCRSRPSILPSPTPADLEHRTATPTGMVPEQYRKYIGTTFPPLPDGMKSGFGTLIYPPADSNWSISIVGKQDQTMLWLGKMTQGQGTPPWEVMDIVLLPTLAENERLVPNGCEIDGEGDPEIIAIVEVTQDELDARHVDSAGIRSAWRANRSLGIFQEIGVSSDLTCYLDNSIRMEWTPPAPRTP